MAPVTSKARKKDNRLVSTLLASHNLSYCLTSMQGPSTRKRDREDAGEIAEERPVKQIRP